ncbi:hypothetical protein MesoLj131a_48430 [Mesorhizobium sp. 131-2-1]|nr:hypothetical protein MesoLj131a_48430 [Mesorhizobium sp. 131-2-1]
MGFSGAGAFGEARLAKAATGRDKAGAAFAVLGHDPKKWDPAFGKIRVKQEFPATRTGPIEYRRCAKTCRTKGEIVRPL